MRKASLIPRRNSDRLTLALLALLVPAYWGEFRNWEFKKEIHVPEAPAPTLVLETDPSRMADSTAGTPPLNPAAARGGQ